jgi:ArsR family transcriptional regulator
MCVCELAFVLGISQPSVSKHIKKLFEAGIIKKRQAGFWTIYYININNAYLKQILRLFSGRLNSDAVVKSDRKRALKADRTKLCCKK